MENRGTKEKSPRKAHHSEAFKKKIVGRLNRIEGQIRGITRMVVEDVYCDDILNQIASIEAALKGVSKSLLEAHIKSCVVEQIKEDNNDVLDELMGTIGRVMK